MHFSIITNNNNNNNNNNDDDDDNNKGWGSSPITFLAVQLFGFSGKVQQHYLNHTKNHRS